jgi:hypothetical protein
MLLEVSDPRTLQGLLERGGLTGLPRDVRPSLEHLLSSHRFSVPDRLSTALSVRLGVRTGCVGRA